ncbi:hypothetical protein OJAV_G00183030 [Oryzias javanicus]|uniref:Uncharacterized protein n=1 Tax=Oryzias javanicus TaxID=123683 RepID=A0A3S2LT72_ORYJA|nr:hypothetical protein OJAV_G00183030 [Oryzias javanicus]
MLDSKRLTVAPQPAIKRRDGASTVIKESREALLFSDFEWGREKRLLWNFLRNLMWTAPALCSSAWGFLKCKFEVS